MQQFRVNLKAPLSLAMPNQCCHAVTKLILGWLVGGISSKKSQTLMIPIYSRSQNNVNVVYCNYKETNSNYNVIAERNLPQSLPNVDNIFKMFVWNFEEACAI